LPNLLAELQRQDSLESSYYKIAGVIGELVDLDQTGFLRGRSIAENFVYAMEVGMQAGQVFLRTSKPAPQKQA